MKKITVDGTQYIGTVSEKGKKTYLKDALQISLPPTKDDFITYLQKKNSGELTSTTFTGQGTSVSESPFTDLELLNLAVCKMTLAAAKKVAAAGTENTLFEKLMGK